MEWDTLEHTYYEKTNDWYASVILIATALIIVEFLFGNFLMITLTVIGTITFILLSARKPEVMHVEIVKTGIRAGNLLYSFNSLEGYAIAEYHHEDRLLLKSSRHIMPLIVIPISEEVDVNMLREILDENLSEEELHESLAHLLLERLGF